MSPIGEYDGILLYRWGDVLLALADEGRFSSGPVVSTSKTTTYEGTQYAPVERHLTPPEVASVLGISRRTLSRVLSALRQQAPELLPNRVGIGETRVRYRWQISKVETWWKEVMKWQRSKNAELHGECGGEIQTAGLGPSVYPMKEPPEGSQRTSNGGSHKR